MTDEQPDICPAGGGGGSWPKQDVNEAQVREMIQNLVSHHVAVTSTLPGVRSWRAGRTHCSGAPSMRCPQIGAKLPDCTR